MLCIWIWLTSHNLISPVSSCAITPFLPFSPCSHVWPMIYAQRQVVNYELYLVMNGHTALCLPLFAAAEAFGFSSVISVCVRCPDNRVYLRQTHKRREGMYLNMPFESFHSENTQEWGFSRSVGWSEGWNHLGPVGVSSRNRFCQEV